MRKEWVESLLDQSRKAAILFFFKQWGGTRKGKAGRELNGRTYDEQPGMSREPMAERRKRMEMVREMNFGHWLPVL